MFDDKEPKISGYLIIGRSHYQIVGQRVSHIRANLTIKKIAEDIQEAEQADMFDERSGASGERKCDIP